MHRGGDEEKKKDTYVEVAQETSDHDDIIPEELVERGHVGLFSEEHIVREVLDDFRDNHKPSLHNDLVFLW